jgi:hypothetical protein
VSASRTTEAELAATRDLVEEVMRTAVALDGIVAALLRELPQGAFPGRETVLVLGEMLVGSAHPAARAAGLEECRTATALVAAIRERVLADLHTAAELAQEHG